MIRRYGMTLTVFIGDDDSRVTNDFLDTGAMATIVNYCMRAMIRVTLK